MVTRQIIIVNDTPMVKKLIRFVMKVPKEYSHDGTKFPCIYVEVILFGSISGFSFSLYMGHMSHYHFSLDTCHLLFSENQNCSVSPRSA